MIDLNTKVSFRVVIEGHSDNDYWYYIDGCFFKKDIIGISEAGGDAIEDTWKYCYIHLSSGEKIKILENYQDLLEWFKTL